MQSIGATTKTSAKEGTLFTVGFGAAFHTALPQQRIINHAHSYTFSKSCTGQSSLRTTGLY